MNQAKRRTVLIPSLVVCAILAILGIYFLSQDNAVEQEQDAMTQGAEVIEEPVHVIRTGIWPEFSEDFLMETASLVVHGSVTRASESFLVESVCGVRTVFTDYYIYVYEIFRGSPLEQEIVVRIEGGSTGEMVLETTLTDVLEIGEEYILFLVVPSGGIMDTPGYYYYLLGGPNGIFRREMPTEFFPFSRDGEDEVIFEQLGIFDKEFDLSELRDEIEKVNALIPPPQEDDFRQMEIDAILENIENGILHPDTDLLDAARSRSGRSASIVG